MAKKSGKARYFRLDKRERKAIEHGLDKRESCRSMARDLGRSASTVHDEVVRTSNVQERANREIERRSKVVQVFPTVKSLERLVGAVMCDQDEEWRASRCFSEKKMAELCDDRVRAAAKTPPSPERETELLLVAKKAIDASLELADELEAA